MISTYIKENQSIPVSWFCSAFGLARSSYYAGLKSIAIHEKLDRQIWQKICDIWETFPGFGHRKLAHKLNMNTKKVLRILRKFRKPRKKRVIEKQPRKIPNVVKLITKSLQKCSLKIRRILIP